MRYYTASCAPCTWQASYTSSRDRDRAQGRHVCPVVEAVAPEPVAYPPCHHCRRPTRPSNVLAADARDARSWVDQALCAEVGGDFWHPENGGSTRDAKTICARCPVRIPCLTEALETHERYGIRGGLSERERRKLEEHGWSTASLTETSVNHYGKPLAC